MTNRILKRLEAVTDKQAAITLFISAFILRLLYALYIFIHQAFDENNAYIIIAKYIIEQGTLFYDINSTYLNAAGPVLPWLNALTLVVFQNNYIGVYIVTALGSSLITFYTYKTARLFLDKMTSFFIGAWSLFYFSYFHFAPTPGKDIWMAFFMIYLIYMFIKLFVYNKFNYLSYLIFILMYVISFHLDERYLIFGPFIFLFILFHETAGFKKLKWKKSILFVLFTVIFMLPWLIRNYQKYNQIVVVTTRTQRFTDKILGYEPKDEYFSDDFTSIKGRYYIHENQIDSVINGTKTHTDAGYKIPKAWIDAMKEGKRPAPLTGVNAFWSRIRTMLEPFQFEGRFEQTGYYYYEKSLKHNLATFLFYGLLFIFSIPGFYFLFKNNRKVFYIFLSTIIIYVLLHALTIPYTNWRYRLPLDSIFIIVGCLGIIKTRLLILSIFKN